MRTFAVRPLVEWDGWAIWAMKARALYDFGGVAHGVFTTQPYGPLQHPLLLPSLEATGFRAMNTFDGTLIHVQLALLAFGFAAALWTLLRERVPAALAGAAILAIVAADSVLRQLAGNLADIPLAFFVALGVVALARTLLDANAALLAVRGGDARRRDADEAGGAPVRGRGARARSSRSRAPAPRCWTAVAVALILLPWRIFTAVHGLKNPEYSLGDALNPAYLADHSVARRPGVLGRLAPGLVERLGLARPVRADRVRRRAARAPLARRRLRGRVGAPLLRRDRPRVLDLRRAGRADPALGRLPNRRVARHRRSRAGAAARRRGLERVRQTKGGLAAPKR